MDKFFIILHNIRSQYNVGSIFRTADGAGVDKIFLTGYTPSPVDEFGRPRSDIHKTALGAEKFVKWEKVKDIGKLIKRLKNERVYIVAVEQSDLAINYKKFKPKLPLSLIFGNEVKGLNKKLFEKCNAILQIPMFGKKESLNVSVAAGIVIYDVKLKLNTMKS